MYRYRLKNLSSMKDIKTFYLPTEKEIKSLKEGDHVKVIFEPGERMWVKITHIIGSLLIGKLDNVPIAVGEVQLGSTIALNRHHICQIDNN